MIKQLSHEMVLLASLKKIVFNNPSFSLIDNLDGTDTAVLYHEATLLDREPSSS